MLLAIDIGNTNVVLGVFDGKRLVANWRVGSKTQITPDEYAMILKDLFNFKLLLAGPTGPLQKTEDHVSVFRGGK